MRLLIKHGLFTPASCCTVWYYLFLIFAFKIYVYLYIYVQGSYCPVLILLGLCDPCRWARQFAPKRRQATAIQRCVPTPPHTHTHKPRPHNTNSSVHHPLPSATTLPKITPLRVKEQLPIDLRYCGAGLFKKWVTEFYARVTTHKGCLGACRQRWAGSTERI